MAIRNPSQEEVEKLLNKDVIHLKKDEENIPSNKELNNLKIYSNELKPKKSKFEPDPKKCTLISGTNYVNEGFIYVRRLNTEEEAKLAEIKDAESLNKIINNVFETAIKSNVSVIDMPLVDKLHVFSFILAISYSDTIQVNDLIDCKNCRDEYPININILKDIKHGIISNDIKIPFKITLSSFDDPYELCFNIPKIKDEDNLFNKDISEIISGLTLYLRDKNGVDIPQEEWQDMMKWISSDDKKQISDILGKMNSYSESFTYVVDDKCKNPNCCTKNKSIKLKIEDIYLKLMNSVTK